MTTDTWFVAFTSHEVTAAWMGFDNASERSMGDEEASYTTATPLWTEFMSAMVRGHKEDYSALPMQRPKGLDSHFVDARLGGPPSEGLPIATIYTRSGE